MSRYEDNCLEIIYEIEVEIFKENHKLEFSVPLKQLESDMSIYEILESNLVFALLMNLKIIAIARLIIIGIMNTKLRIRKNNEY